MSALDTLKAHLDAACNQLVGSDLYRSEIMQASKDYRDGGTYTETWTRLQNLAAQIFETAALLADDDITELTATIANEKDVKMAEYKLPALFLPPETDQGNMRLHPDIAAALGIKQEGESHD